MFLQKYKGFFN